MLHCNIFTSKDVRFRLH